MTVTLRTVGIVILLLMTLAAASAFLFVYLGVYNISATDQHTKPVYQLLEYAMRRAVKQRSDSISVPDLSDRKSILNGADHYRAHCLQCHGAPGVSPHSLAFGMTPAPVNLVSTAREWPAAEIYWVIRHGIKMSGMPAWEYQLKDQEIWDLVAFVKALPGMSPKDYAALTQQLPKEHEHKHGDARTPHPPPGTQHAAPSSAPPPAKDSVRTEGPLLGEVNAGKRAIGQYLCATCHQIPGIVGANRHVGPPLNGIAKRRYIAGILINNPENMVDWLQNPHRFDPLSAMPNLGVTEKDARDIAAYLYTLDSVE